MQGNDNIGKWEKRHQGTDTRCWERQQRPLPRAVREVWWTWKRVSFSHLDKPEEGDGRMEEEETTGQQRHIGPEVWQRIKALFQTLTLHPDMGPDTGTGYHLIASENLWS